MAVVVDSFLLLENIDFNDALVIVDEAEQLGNHCLTANTAIKNNRSQILTLLENKLSQCKKLVLLDADLSDLCCDWFSKVSNKVVFKIGSELKNQSSNCYLIDEEKQLNAIVIKKLKRGQKVAIISDSRTHLEAFRLEIENQVKEVRGNIDLVTSETAKESFTQDFMVNPDKAIEDNQTYCLIFSPVAQSGISIDSKGYFDAVIGYCFGIVEPSIMRQLLMRVRDNCDCYLYITKRPIAKYENVFDYKQVLKNDNLSELIRQFSDYRQGLIDAGFDKVTIDLMMDAIKNLKPESNTNIHQVHRAKLIARHNLLMSDYRNNLINELEDEGYELIQTSDYEDEVDLTANKQELLTLEANLILKEEPQPPEKIKYLEPTTKREKAIVTKSIIVDSLPNLELTVELIVAEFLKGRWQNITAVKRYWYTQNQDVAKKNDRKQYHYALKNHLDGNQFWLHDYKFYSQWVHLFEVLELSNLINDDLPLTNKDERITVFYDACKKHRLLLNKCSIRFGNRSKPIALLGKILKYFSFKLKGKQYPNWQRAIEEVQNN